MDERFHSFQRKVEDWHWWYRVRRDILDGKLASLGLDPRSTQVLDVGCGTGGSSLVLSKYGRVFGLDSAPASFAISTDRPYAGRVVARFGEPLPLADSSFDVVCALDIIEHIEDDLGGARELYRVCRPGGTAIVFAPAFQILWGYNDEFSRHRRRYLEHGLTRVMSAAGFRMLESGYFNILLYVPTLAARLMQRLFPKLTEGMEHSTRPSRLNDLLVGIFRLELPLLKRTRLPFGTSVFCVARKRT